MVIATKSYIVPPRAKSVHNHHQTAEGKVVDQNTNDSTVTPIGQLTYEDRLVRKAGIVLVSSVKLLVIWLRQ